MAGQQTNFDSINVLIDSANWAWPQAVNQIFRPRGINALIAQSPSDAVQIATANHLHLAILDMRNDQPSSPPDEPTAKELQLSGIKTLQAIRNQDPRLPCILITAAVTDRILADALALGVFSVVPKPVNIDLLAHQIDRLFIKRFHCNIFSTPGHPNSPSTN